MLRFRARFAVLLLGLVACTLEEVPPDGGTTSAGKVSEEFLGLRSAVYRVADLAAAKAWYGEVLGVAPYVDQPDYVGFNIGGFELGLVPDTAGIGDSRLRGTPYWGVADAATTYARLKQKGATDHEPVEDVGGVKIGAVRDPFGNVLGVVENPAFRYAAPRTAGPGR